MMMYQLLIVKNFEVGFPSDRDRDAVLNAEFYLSHNIVICFPFNKDTTQKSLFLVESGKCLLNSVGRITILQNNSVVPFKAFGCRDALEPSSGLSKRPDFLRRCAVIFTANRPLKVWDGVIDEVCEVSNLKGRFVVMALSDDTIVAEFACTDDPDAVLNAETIFQPTQ